MELVKKNDLFFLVQNDEGGNKMKEEKAFFKVKEKKFWILEQRLNESTKGAKGDYNVNAWVFNNEKDAILRMKDLLAEENLDFSKLDELAESITKRYNLQEVEIARDKYNMKAISWLKVALLGFSQK